MVSDSRCFHYNLIYPGVRVILRGFGMKIFLWWNCNQFPDHNDSEINVGESIGQYERHPNSYSISHLLGTVDYTVTGQWWPKKVHVLLTTAGSTVNNCVVTVLPAVNGDYSTAIVMSICSHCAYLVSDGIGVFLCTASWNTSEGAPAGKNLIRGCENPYLWEKNSVYSPPKTSIQLSCLSQWQGDGT